MSLLIPNLATATGARIVVNSLDDFEELGFLTQDLLLVELPGKTYIDVSWFPEHDQGGAYTLVSFVVTIRFTMSKRSPLTRR